VADANDLPDGGVLLISDYDASEVLKLAIHRAPTYPQIALAMERYLMALLPELKSSLSGETT
jgi:hypothetical protein